MSKKNNTGALTIDSLAQQIEMRDTPYCFMFKNALAELHDRVVIRDNLSGDRDKIAEWLLSSEEADKAYELVRGIIYGLAMSGRISAVDTETLIEELIRVTHPRSDKEAKQE